MDTRTGAHPGIVVGVDGSASSREALAWALRQARLDGREVEAVIAWHLPPTSGWGGVPVPGSALEEAARETLAEAVDGERAAVPDVPVTRRVVEGNAGQVLVEASRGAGLLVVGCRGLGGMAGVLLGSVSRHCAEHAKCPVLVVRDGAA
ncbi:universal stress protein [Kitasatospora sp. NPDC058048]|uniref:universal stress protein n=1 Tax=Kitasatospora sp. NPDC058048 TaxID=3346313 RepID=UPI0036DD1787